MKYPLLLISLAALLLSCVGAGVKARSDFADARWTVLGPFDNPENPAGICPGFLKDHLGAYGGEAALSDPSRPGLPAGEGTATSASGGTLRFDSLFPGRTWSVAYAYREFESGGGAWVFRMGSDDGIRVWINGRLLLDNHAHRSLNPNDEAFSADLRPGKNRILVKVCQAAGEWSMAAATMSAEENAALARAMPSFTVSANAASLFADSGGSLSFAPRVSPSPGIEFPLSWSLTDAGGSVVASGDAGVGRTTTVSLPPSVKGILYLNLFPGKALEASVSSRFRVIPEQVFLVGNAGTLFAEHAALARRTAAAEMSRSTAAALRGMKGTPQGDIESTLELLADRLAGKLHASLELPELRIKAVGFVEDIVAAAARGPEALSAMPGYRQMAYRSPIDGSVQPYSLYIPEGYTPVKKYGLVVMVHGYSGEDHVWGSHVARLKPADFLILSAFGRGDIHYRSLGEQDVLDVMDRVITGYSVDPDRVYLVGNSMGGLGTWKIGSLFPDRFAAIAPFSGWTGTEWLANLLNLGVFVVHGDSDTTVPVRMDRAAVAELKRLGCPVTYEEIKGGTHYTWTEWAALHDPNTILDYFRSRRRDPSPARISARVPYARYGKQYWIRIEELDTSGALLPVGGSGEEILLPAPGSVDAERVSPSEIRIATKRVMALTVDLKQAGMDASRPVAVKIDGTGIDAAAGASSLSLAMDSGGTWRVESDPPGRTKARHDGGGIADLFTAPLFIVYGTADPARAPLLEAAARRLADWSWTEEIQIGTKIGAFRVVSDAALTDVDMRAANIILIGSPSENAVSRRLSSILSPFYSGGSISVQGRRFDGYGLCLVSPNPAYPQRLVGYFDIPASFLRDEGAVRNWFRYFPFRFRNSVLSEAATYPGFSPDVMVITGHPLRDAWSGWFDRNWENLEGR